MAKNICLPWRKEYILQDLKQKDFKIVSVTQNRGKNMRINIPSPTYVHANVWCNERYKIYMYKYYQVHES